MIGPTDTPPTDGVWQDWDGTQHDPAVIEAGNALGRALDDYLEDDTKVPL